MNFLFLYCFFIFIPFPLAKSVRIISENLWKIRLNGTEMQIIHPEMPNIPNRVYNFAYSQDQICTIIRGDDGLFRFRLLNIFTMVLTSPMKMDFGMDQVFSPMNFDHFLNFRDIPIILSPKVASSSMDILL